MCSQFVVKKMVTTWETLKYLMEFEADTEVFKFLGETKKSFSELKKKFANPKSNSTLSRALRRLSKYGLVYHVYAERSQGSNVYSFYEATPIGKKILKLYEDMEAMAKEK
jgi:DNA-binding HxlR family transcriptional regulator